MDFKIDHDASLLVGADVPTARQASPSTTTAAVSIASTAAVSIAPCEPPLAKTRAKTRSKRAPSTVSGGSHVARRTTIGEQAGSMPAYEKDYVEQNLIAYIGNKRRLLPLISKALAAIREHGTAPLRTMGQGPWFADYFSGTGVVARMAKSMGFHVLANDWEPYTRILNHGFLTISNEELDDLFADEGGVDAVLDRLNSLTSPPSPTSLGATGKDTSYIAKYYSPRSTEHANPNEERMFYTRENGILIDNIRTAIEEKYPVDAKDARVERKRNFLLALLLVESSKRANTSGVFKGFHHGFGGRKGDALKRILSPITLRRPVLFSAHKKSSVQSSAQSSAHRAATGLAEEGSTSTASATSATSATSTTSTTDVKIFTEDALALTQRLHAGGKGKTMDVVYLDPPYNQHQYGSNYHMLNTIALWDRPALSEKFWVGGKKVRKAGIREDWTRTRSTFCARATALRDFKKLLGNIAAKYIMVSYSTEGIMDFDALLGVLGEKGHVSVITHPYVRFRGARQTNVTKTLNVEFILIVEVGRSSTPEELVSVRRAVGMASCVTDFDEFFPIHRPAAEYQVRAEDDGSFRIDFDEDIFGVPGQLILDERLHIRGGAESLTPEMIEVITRVLPKTNAERIFAITEWMEQWDESEDKWERDARYFLGELLRLYKKVLGERHQQALITQVRACIRKALTTGHAPTKAEAETATMRSLKALKTLVR